MEFVCNAAHADLPAGAAPDQDVAGAAQENRALNDYYYPKMRRSALDDLVEYLNARFFSFPACGNPRGLF
jgi:hypothetical protein